MKSDVYLFLSNNSKKKTRGDQLRLQRCGCMGRYVLIYVLVSRIDREKLFQQNLSESQKKKKE